MRGRPALQMTPRRAQVRAYWGKHGPCPLGQVMRACGLHDRSSVKRILRDLEKLGEVTPIPAHAQEPASPLTPCRVP